MRPNGPLDDAAIGARLRASREEKRILLAQAASAIGLTESMMSLLERGLRPISPLYLMKLSRLYEKPIGYLLVGWSEGPDNLYALAGALRDDQRDHVLAFAAWLYYTNQVPRIRWRAIAPDGEW
ncbi:MAG: helix-turn-helix transcriptional regulator [Ktedonobacterales bacterium]|nr:helix-turn-helix transcriptional regulator [Ktedonobacterales bacterium]